MKLKTPWVLVEASSAGHLYFSWMNYNIAFCSFGLNFDPLKITAAPYWTQTNVHINASNSTSELNEVKNTMRWHI